MPTPRVAVLRAPGTNCDHETAHAFELCGATAERIHLNRVLEQPEILHDFQVLCIPGGFSYGDDIGSGVIFASQLRSRLAGALTEFLQADKLCLGICNGFQVLLKSGILPSGSLDSSLEARQNAPATLTWNDNGKYTARWVHLRTGNSKNVFLRGIEALDLPIAHAEGRIVVRDAAVLDSWRKNHQLALCYSLPGATDPDPTSASLQFPVNPNGSIGNLAGLSDPTGRILGLMPHPERFIFRTQHPQWTRLDLPDEGAGLQLFRNAVAYFG
jgi:phosphoribosylformylglycinamidine synthase I